MIYFQIVQNRIFSKNLLYSSKKSSYTCPKKKKKNSSNYKMNNFYNPMDTSSSIRHRFDIEILRGKFVKITSILKGESTCKLWHRFDVEVSTWIPLSKSMKYHWVFLMDFSMSFRRRIEVTSLLVDSILSFSNIFCPPWTYSRLFWYSAESI